MLVGAVSEMVEAVFQRMRDKFKCDHCGRFGHLKDTCWDLHDRPQEFQDRPQCDSFAGGCGGSRFVRGGRSSANLVTSITPDPTPTLSTESASSSFSRDEIEALRCFMSSLDASTSSPQTSFAHSGTFAFAFSANVSSSGHSWIIDLGASDHMIGTSSLFSSYSICYGKDKVRIADGSYSSIAGKRNISVTLSLPLTSVLHVPKFTLNLLSVSHLTKSLNYSISFFPSHCVFQDLSLRKVISRGHEDNGLYILDIPPHSALPVQ